MVAGSFNVVAATDDAEREVSVTVESPTATVGDLLRALRIDADHLAVDDARPVPADHDLVEVEIRHGARLAGADGAARRRAGVPPVVVLEVVGGPDSGARFELTPGPHLIGRQAPAAILLPSEAVSAVHAELVVDGTGAATIADRSSRNGTWVDGEEVTEPRPLAPGQLVRVGNVELRLAPIADDAPRLDRALNLHSPTVPFNRPPRAALPEPPPPVTVPKAPAERSGVSPIGIFAILGPLLFAAVMVVSFGSWRFAIFGLLTPVMIVGTYVDNRRRHRKTSRREGARFRGELEDLDRALGEAVALERARREAAWPSPAEVCRRAELPSTRLWERRAHAPDFLTLRVATGTGRWEPPVVTADRGEPAEEAVEVIDRHRRVPEAAVAVDLQEVGVVGLVGDRSASLAVARSLVAQAAVLSGPADLVVAVFTSPERQQDWDWVKWLPHAHDPDLGTSFLAADREGAAAVVRQLERTDRSATVLAVVDDLELLQGRRAPVRQLLQGQSGAVAGIVCSPTADRLPAVVAAELHLHDDLGRASLVVEDRTIRDDDLLATGMSDATARRCARRLARFEDPELAVVAADLPDACRLIPLLGLAALDADAILDRWSRQGPDPAPGGPIGVTGDDVFELDLVRDGPHGLIGGTTGSGKSELLRTMVATMAASSSPDHLSFVLIDFKGGSAFDACARLPHTVGVVTDLDEHLAERALRCLEAELQHRERVLREAGVGDLPEYLRAGHGARAPLPRLLVVIDEFATLKEELPDFVDALVGIAQRGRSLGVHMVLATQRPSGAVSETIKANTNLRIALRVQDTQDSTDVIGVPDAARIPRGRHGRAYIRLGPGEVVPIQTAWSMAPPRGDTTEPVELRPFAFGAAPVRAGGLEAGDTTELDLLVEAVAGAFERTGAPPPRRPWPDPLPEHVPIASLPAPPPDEPADDLVPIALGDDPDRQRQVALGWRPSAGNLLVYGIGGAGTTTALRTLLLALAARRPPDRTHLYVVDMGAGELAALEDLPHMGAYVRAAEAERRVRLLRHLRDEMGRRRSLTPDALAAEPELVVAIDAYGPFMAEFDDATDRATIDAFTQLVTNGAEVGIRFLLAVDRPGGIAPSVASTVRQRIVLRLADAYAYTNLGVPARHVPDLPPGRGFHLETGLLAQLAVVDDVVAEVAAIAARWPAPERAPQAVQLLEPALPLPAGTAADLGRRPWSFPVAVSEATLAPAALSAYVGEHVLVAGPARSGRTTALATLGALARAGGARVVAVAGARSPLPSLLAVDEHLAPEALDGLEGPVDGRPTVVLVDDADTFEAPGGLAALFARDDVLVAAAGRNTALRKGYNHWTRAVRESRLGLLLVPDVDLDGELLGARIPRRAPVAMVPGRGYLVSGGDALLVQVALPAPP